MEQEEGLKMKWTKKERQRVEQKWSFNEMLNSLATSYKGNSFEMLRGLAYEYRMCSHITHGDETGVNIIEERKARIENEKNDVHRGHFLKLLSNCLSYSSFASFTIFDHLKLDKSFILENFKKITPLEPLIAKYQMEVFKDSSYDKYR